MKKIWMVVLLVPLGVIAWLLCFNGGDVSTPTETVPVAKPTDHPKPKTVRPPARGERSAERETADAVTPEPEEAKTAEEKAAEAEEKLVDDFDALTDKWMEPAKGEVSMAEVDRFVAQFKGLPPDRKDECLHRALNLVPDENVMLLAGILLDKSIEKEYVELVFNDVLNRDEDVKKPILNLIFKDKTHPCWTDVAWILDVTGELPAKK